jgi:hypothetical protein
MEILLIRKHEAKLQSSRIDLTAPDIAPDQ